MHQNSPVSEVRHSFETESTRFTPTGAAGVDRAGQRTGVGAVVMTVAPIAVVVAASYPAIAAIVVAVAAAAFGAGKYATRAAPPGDSDQQSRVRDSDKNIPAACSD